MGNKRELKEDCYLEVLKDNVVSVEMIMNRLRQIEHMEGIIDENILYHDRNKTILDLELALATLCVLLRKMAENLFITLSQELRKDINSIIHSNRFEYAHDEVVVYSQKGRESVELDELLAFCHQVIENDKVCK